MLEYIIETINMGLDGIFVILPDAVYKLQRKYWPVHSYPLFTHCHTVHRYSKHPPSLITSGLNGTWYMLLRWSSSAWFKKSQRPPIG